MLREFFSRNKDTSDQVFSRIASNLASRIPREQDLAARLKGFAAALSDLKEVAGTLVVACEESGEPLAHGASRLTIRDSGSPYAALVGVEASLPGGDFWTEVNLAQIEISDAHSIRARRLLDEEKSLGFLVVGFRGAPSPPVLKGLDKAQLALSRILRNSLQFSHCHLLQDLWKLEAEALGRSTRIEPQVIADGLRRIFKASAVTILVREQGRFYLSATTDAELRKTTTAYDAEDGLVGHTLSTGKGVRLRNARDSREVEQQVGSQLPSDGEDGHLEDLARTGDPYRLLTVNLPPRWRLEIHKEHSETVKGVKSGGAVRVLRALADSPFSRVEQSALEQFATLLAMAMYSSWRLELADSVLEAETEAICITRNEPGQGHRVPKLVRADAGAEKLFGLSKDELSGYDARRLYADGEYEKINKILDETIEAGKEVCGPILTKVPRFNAPGDEVRSVEISYRLLTSPFVTPKTYYTVAVIRDTTEDQVRVEQHKRLLSLLDQRGLAYFCADQDSRTVESSSTESRLSGYSEDELKGKFREDLYAEPAHRKDLLRLIHERDGQLVHTMQRLKRKDGRHFLAEGAIHLLKDDRGRRVGYEALYEDVTDRVELQGLLDLEPGEIITEHELYERLKEDTKFNLKFMSSLSHQLRSPLGALVQTLLNFEEGVVQHEMFQKRLKYAIGQAHVCSLLVANFTYMDKILRSEHFEFKKVNLARLAIETKLNFVHIAEEKRIPLIVDDASFDKNLKLAWGHRELLRQVLVNLYDNALKYSLDGAPVRISAHEGGTQGRYLQVTNRGLSVGREFKDRIFERGFRTEEAKAKEPAGTGLGLWLVRKIAKAHGATIRCTDILEEGEERVAFQMFFPGIPKKQSYKTRGRS